MDRGLGVFLDQSNGSAERDDLSERCDESLQDTERSVERDEWIWPNVVGDRPVSSDDEAERGADEGGSSDEFHDGSSKSLGLPEMESTSDTHPVSIEELQSGEDEWEDVHENGAALEGEVGAESGSESASSGSTPQASIDSDPFALEADRPPTPPTSSISQITFPELPGQRTPRPGPDSVFDTSQSATGSREPQQWPQQLQNVDWTRMLVEDRAWLVVLLALYMMANQ